MSEPISSENITPYITIGEAVASPIPMPVTYEVQKSKFLAYVKPVASEDDIRHILQAVNKKHFDARHAPYAWIIGETELNRQQKSSDDGEPGGTAGMPILEVIKNNQLTNTLIIVVRYFGGIKLGAGGLIRAYAQAATMGINNAPKIKMTPLREVEVNISYDRLATLEHFIRTHDIATGEISYTDSVTVPLLLAPENIEFIKASIIDLTAGSAIIKLRGIRLTPLPYEP